MLGKVKCFSEEVRIITMEISTLDKIIRNVVAKSRQN
jgi:hypothetical protein